MNSTGYSGQILMKLEFYDRWSKNTQISWKSFHWKLSCSMRTDGQTDRK